MFINPEIILTWRTIRDPSGTLESRGIAKREGEDPKGMCKDRRRLPRWRAGAQGIHMQARNEVCVHP